MTEERRSKNCCMFCGGEELKFHDGEDLKIICLICGQDFVACRAEDYHRFHREADIWHE